MAKFGRKNKDGSQLSTVAPGLHEPGYGPIIKIFPLQHNTDRLISVDLQTIYI